MHEAQGLAAPRTGRSTGPGWATRRRLIRGAAGAAGLAGVLLAACDARPGNGGGERPAPRPVTLTYLRYYNQPDRLEGEKAVFRRLADQNPGLTIDELTVAGTD